jgi:hypothetical protein
MRVKFELSPEAYVCMLGKLSKFSSAFASLRNARSNVRSHAGMMPLASYIVESNEEDADLFLTLAKAHCPEAGPAIEEAIKDSRAGGC